MPQRSFSRHRPPPSDSALDAGLRLLARRAHSRVELLLKLTRRGYDGGSIRAALRRLEELGYLDDQSFARSFVRRRGSVRGPRALAAELAARGVDRAQVDTAVAEFGEAEQLAAATQIAERLYARKPSAGYRETLDEIGTKLVRRGFSVSVARAACHFVLAGRPDPSPA
ncbi:MAG TPA: regulatory protein RecX [Candidatus Dormibacteraeota bacterium]